MIVLIAEKGIFHLQKARNWCRLCLYTNLVEEAALEELAGEMPVDLVEEIRVTGAFSAYNHR